MVAPSSDVARKQKGGCRSNGCLPTNLSTRPSLCPTLPPNLHFSQRSLAHHSIVTTGCLQFDIHIHISRSLTIRLQHSRATSSSIYTPIGRSLTIRLQHSRISSSIYIYIYIHIGRLPGPNATAPPRSPSPTDFLTGSCNQDRAVLQNGPRDQDCVQRPPTCVHLPPPPSLHGPDGESLTDSQWQASFHSWPFIMFSWCWLWWR